MLDDEAVGVDGDDAPEVAVEGLVHVPVFGEACVALRVRRDGERLGLCVRLMVYRSGEIEPIVVEVAQAVFPALANARQLVADVAYARAAWGERIRARRGASAWALADLVTTHPVVDTRLVAVTLGVTTVNAQLAIDRLVEDGVLEQIGRGSRDRVWQAP